MIKLQWKWLKVLVEKLTKNIWTKKNSGYIIIVFGNKIHGENTNVTKDIKNIVTW
jgi:hypothetical protein